MEKSEQIKLRRLLKKNGFVKTDTKSNKKLMEFIKAGIDNNLIIVYTYDLCEVYFGTDSDYIFFTIEQFKYLYEKETKQEFQTH